MAPLQPDPRAGLRLLAAATALSAILAASLVRHGPPSPRGPDAPPEEFSAARAGEILRDLSPGGEPRPVGSVENGAAASRIASRLRALGLEVSEQETFACGAWGICARVRNVAARIPAAPGGEARPAVLLAAHHDSVQAGPGISDDLSGVAAMLEVARALRSAPPLPRPVVLLSTDGEEVGLAGMAAFAASHPWAPAVGAAVNVEARGTSGPSVMFDTSGEAPFLVGALRTLPRPVTTSVAPALYDLIPNDTDLTVLEERGVPGLNFAFAEGVVRYHTPRDDLAHLSRASLQHHGENALAAVRALARADLERPGSARAVFFDVLALGVLAWPEALGVPLALAALALSLAAAGLLVRRGVRPSAVAAGLAAAAAAPALAAALAWALGAALGATGAVPRPFVAHPGPVVATIFAAGAAGALAPAALLGRRSRAEGHLPASAILLAALSLAAALAFPGGSYLFLVPSVAGAAAALAWSATGREGIRTAVLAGAALAGLPLLEVILHLPPMLGAPAAPVVAALVALVALPLGSASAGLGPRGRRIAPAAAAGAALLATATAALFPHATADAPERMSVAWHEEDGRGRAVVEAEGGKLPAAIRALGEFPARPEPAFPWLPMRLAFAAPAPAAGIPPPRAEVLTRAPAGDGRRVTVRLVSPRGAPALLLALPPGADLRSLSVDGVAAPPRAVKARAWFGGWHLVGSATAPAEGIVVDLLLGGEAPVDAVAIDQSPDLPELARRVAAARPPTGVPSQEGDVTVATAKVRL